MLSITESFTAQEMGILLSQRCKALRLQRGYKRSTLAQRAGVSEASLKRFETCGLISLKNLLRLAQVLDRLAEFSELFLPLQAQSLAQLREQEQKKGLQRGRI